MKKLAIGFWVLAALSAWLIWGPLLNFVYSLVPQNQWAGLIKLIITLCIGYFGGIAIPLALIFFGIVFFLKMI